MGDYETAYLENEGNCICFSYQGKKIRFKGPYSLIGFEKVKEWDNGYLVVDANYTHSDELY